MVPGVCHAVRTGTVTVLDTAGITVEKSLKAQSDPGPYAVATHPQRLTQAASLRQVSGITWLESSHVVLVMAKPARSVIDLPLETVDRTQWPVVFDRPP